MEEWNKLLSPKAEDVESALEAAREKGDIRWVRPLLEAFRDAPEAAIQEAIREVLASLKISEAGDIFHDVLEDPDFEGMQADIIGFMWSTTLMPEEALLAVTRAGVSGDFRCAMEALTWIEQIEGVTNENDLLEAILLVRGAVEDSDREEIWPLAQPMLDALQAMERAQ